jgi:hypothetical protein
MALSCLPPGGRGRCRRRRVGSRPAGARRVRAPARSLRIGSGDRQADQVLDERSDVDPRPPAGGRLAGSRRKAPPGARGTGARVRLIRAASGPSFSRAPGPTERTRRPPPASRQSRGVRLQRRDLPRPAVLGPQVPERRAGACAARQLRRRGRSSELSVRLQQDRRPAVALMIGISGGSARAPDWGWVDSPASSECRSAEAPDQYARSLTRSDRTSRLDRDRRLLTRAPGWAYATNSRDEGTPPEPGFLTDSGGGI